MPKSDMVITPGIILMVLTLAGIVKSQCDTTYTDVLTRVWGYYDVESSNNTLVVGAADSLIQIIPSSSVQRTPSVCWTNFMVTPSVILSR